VAGEVVAMVKYVKIAIKDLDGIDRLEDVLARQLDGYGAVDRIEGLIEVKTYSGHIIEILLRRDGDGVSFGVSINPNLDGFERTDAVIYPRRVTVINVDYAIHFISQTVLALKDCLFLLSQIVLYRIVKERPRYYCLVVSMEEKQNGDFAARSSKVLLSYGKDIGYEVVRVNSRLVYRINLRSFEVFKDFMNVILPEFLETSGKVVE
jgi:hypothetical protein